MTNETRTTRDRVFALRQENPRIRAREIAETLGISTERAYQHLYALGLPTGVPGDRRGQPRPRALTGGVPVKISCSATGTVSELLIAADLMARGHTPFFPMIRTASCDLVCVDRRTGLAERIEVKTGHRNPAGFLRYNSPQNGANYDRLAVVITGEPVMYSPPFPGEDEPPSEDPRP